MVQPITSNLPIDLQFRQRAALEAAARQAAPIQQNAQNLQEVEALRQTALLNDKIARARELEHYYQQKAQTATTEEQARDFERLSYEQSLLQDFYSRNLPFAQQGNYNFESVLANAEVNVQNQLSKLPLNAPAPQYAAGAGVYIDKYGNAYSFPSTPTNASDYVYAGQPQTIVSPQQVEQAKIILAQSQPQPSVIPRPKLFQDLNLPKQDNALLAAISQQQIQQQPFLYEKQLPSEYKNIPLTQVTYAEYLPKSTPQGIAYERYERPATAQEIASVGGVGAFLPRYEDTLGVYSRETYEKYKPLIKAKQFGEQKLIQLNEATALIKEDLAISYPYLVGGYKLLENVVFKPFAASKVILTDTGTLLQEKIPAPLGTYSGATLKVGAEFIPTSFIQLGEYYGIGKLFQYAPKIMSAASLGFGGFSFYTAKTPEQQVEGLLFAGIGTYGLRRSGILSRERLPFAKSTERLENSIFYKKGKEGFIGTRDFPGTAPLAYPKIKELGLNIEALEAFTLRQLERRGIDITKVGDIEKQFLAGQVAQRLKRRLDILPTARQLAIKNVQEQQLRELALRTKPTINIEVTAIEKEVAPGAKPKAKKKTKYPYAYLEQTTEPREYKVVQEEQAPQQRGARQQLVQVLEKPEQKVVQISAQPSLQQTTKQKIYAPLFTETKQQQNQLSRFALPIFQQSEQQKAFQNVFQVSKAKSAFQTPQVNVFEKQVQQQQFQFPFQMQKVMQQQKQMSRQMLRYEFARETQQKKKKSKDEEKRRFIRTAPLFSVFLKSRGRFYPASTRLSESKAYQVAQEKLLSSLSRTAKLKQQGYTDIVDSETARLDERLFRPYRISQKQRYYEKGLVIQKSGINTKLEAQLLQQARLFSKSNVRRKRRK